MHICVEVLNAQTTKWREIIYNITQVILFKTFRVNIFYGHFVTFDE